MRLIDAHSLEEKLDITSYDVFGDDESGFSYDRVCTTISKVPTAVNVGKWLYDTLDCVWRCSSCGKSGSTSWYACPKCGTVMIINRDGPRPYASSRYVMHDLTKDESDVPAGGQHVLMEYEDGSFEIGEYWENEKWGDVPARVVAWYDLPRRKAW